MLRERATDARPAALLPRRETSSSGEPELVRPPLVPIYMATTTPHWRTAGGATNLWVLVEAKANGFLARAAEAGHPQLLDYGEALTRGPLPCELHAYKQK